MKNIIFVFFVVLLTCMTSFGQKLTLTDLTNLCSKKNWEDVNQILLSKNWTYYESKKGDTYRYNAISWSFNRDYYSDKAQGWFHLFTYDGFPNKVSYVVFNKESYTLIQNSISSAGFKLTDSKIEDDEIISSYSNAGFVLKITTQKREQQDYSWDSKIMIAYTITLIKKEGIYDPNNGKKIDYHYGDVVETEYTLLNGKLNGPLKAYYINGQLKKTGNYLNGVENGFFQEYDEDGIIQMEYSMLNGKLNGQVKVYHENGQLKKVGTYSNGIENGSFQEYDEEGQPMSQYSMLNGKPNGSFKIYNPNGKLRKTGAFLNEKQHGNFVEYDDDGNISSEYSMSNGELNGTLKVYYPNGKLKKVSNFLNGKEHGDFIEYDEDGNKEQEYSVSNEELHGTSKIYHLNGKLKKVSNFLNGKEHGHFIEYNEQGGIMFEYAMSHGELNGFFKIYHPNGKLKKTSNFLNGKEHGQFIEYDEQGGVIAECTILDDMKNGPFRVYENGQIKTVISFKDNLKHGPFIQYYYNEQTRKLQLKVLGEYWNEKDHGSWKTILVKEDSSEVLLEYFEYTQGIKNGPFQNVEGDSLIIGTYKDDKLHGSYRLYRDASVIIDGGIVNPDTNKLVLIDRGTYYEGIQSGYWKSHDISGSLISEGAFSMGQKNGEWKFYYFDLVNTKGETLPYSKQLYLVQNYLNGKLHGKSTRYSFFLRQDYPCSEVDDTYHSSDTCFRDVYVKIFETSYYKNDKLDGPFELRDSNNVIISKGNFKENLKEGEWMYRHDEVFVNGEKLYIHTKGTFKADTRHGQWEEYLSNGVKVFTYNYKNGNLDGDYVKWNSNSKPIHKKMFLNGKLVELTVYDSLGLKPLNKYQIYKETSDSYKCLKTEYYADNTYSTQDYWVKKQDEDIDHLLFELQFLMALDDENGKVPTGYPDGYSQLFNSENQLVIKGEYHKQTKTGLWVFYYYDQSVKIEYNFDNNVVINEKYVYLNDNLYSGKFIYYDNLNGIKEERKIKNGLRDGKTIYIDLKTKKVIKKEKYEKGVLKQ